MEPYPIKFAAARAEFIIVPSLKIIPLFPVRAILPLISILPNEASE